MQNGNNPFDGIDHINIYSKGNTKLGRLLSNFTKSPILTIDGDFQSIEGYWYWLGSEHPGKESLRFLDGYRAKEFGRELNIDDWYRNDLYFKLKICDAFLCKVINNSELFDLLKKNTLPFKHYYTYNKKIISPNKGMWILDCWEFISRLIKNDE